MVQAIPYLFIAILFIPNAIVSIARAHQSVENNSKLDHERHLLRGENSRCSVVPPFSSPFPVSNSEPFDIISSCPFRLYEELTQQEARGCFPMYSVPQWDSSSSASFQIHEFNEKLDDSLFFEMKSIYARTEDITIMSNSNMEKLEQCIEDLNFRFEGVYGEIRIENKNVNLVAITISFKEYEEEKTILLPIGGCEGYSSVLVNDDRDWRRLTMTRLSASENSCCSIRPDNIEWNECTQKCYSATRSNCIDEINKLFNDHKTRLAKIHENKEAVLSKLLITRTTQLSTAFARCKCKHGNQDLDQCLLPNFLDTIIAENEYNFEVDKAFDQHAVEVESWFQNTKIQTCDISSRAASECFNEC